MNSVSRTGNRAMRVALAAGLLALECLAQTPPAKTQTPPVKRQRDLKYEKDSPPPDVTAPVSGSLAIPRSYALVVGVARYPKLPDSGQLLFPERDAEAIYSILISPEGGNFRVENVHKLIGEKATLANVRQELESWLPAMTNEDDRVLIYFAGHGFMHQGKAYLAPYDIDPQNIAASGYPMEALGRTIGGKIKGKWKVLLTDSCHSGAITPEGDAQAINKSLLDLNRSLFSLTASRDRERSFESAQWGGGHGIFTYYVVKGMEGSADESGDGVVTADELAEYVHRNVREATNGMQNPTSDKGSFDTDMLISFSPSGAKPGVPPPPKFGGLVVESNMDGVEVFVNGKSVGVVSKSAPLRLPGLQPGVHTIKGVRLGFEPDGPREETVYPGQETTVTLKILIPRRRTKAAVDHFESGVESYNKGTAENYRRAASEFSRTLELDPNYSQAALYLARAHRDLFELPLAEKYFRRAIEIDPDYLEARAALGGMLLDTGSLDESIRQLNAVTQRDRNHSLGWYLLAQAYRMKELYPDSINAARNAIRLAPKNAEAHFWLAESMRLSADHKGAVAEYQEYLRLSDFDSKLAGKMNYYVLGFLAGMGRKKRAAQQDVWRDLRSLAYFGLCDSERQQSRFDHAIPYCQKSIVYDQNDAYAHYALALCYARKAQMTGNIETLPAARKHFRTMLDINAELTESDFAKKNIASIDALLKNTP